VENENGGANDETSSTGFAAAKTASTWYCKTVKASKADTEPKTLNPTTYPRRPGIRLTRRVAARATDFSSGTCMHTMPVSPRLVCLVAVAAVARAQEILAPGAGCTAGSVLAALEDGSGDTCVCAAGFSVYEHVGPSLEPGQITWCVYAALRRQPCVRGTTLKI
jgi:hypothetical protein